MCVGYNGVISVSIGEKLPCRGRGSTPRQFEVEEAVLVWGGGGSNLRYGKAAVSVWGEGVGEAAIWNGGGREAAVWGGLCYVCYQPHAGIKHTPWIYKRLRVQSRLVTLKKISLDSVHAVAMLEIKVRLGWLSSKTARANSCTSDI